jgi:lysophospholipase L1-like esterase
MRIPKFYFIIAAVLLTVSCSESKTPSIGLDATIVAFGDSLTFGKGASNGQTYPKYLAELTDRHIVNAGVSGETTAQGLKRFQITLDKHQPELVILLEGGNDILRNHSSSKIKNNLAKMIEIAQKDKITVVLIGVPEKKLFSDSAPFYYELAEEYNLIFAEDLLSNLIKTSKYKSDPIHFNSAGYKKLAEEIYQLLLDNNVLD